MAAWRNSEHSGASVRATLSRQSLARRGRVYLLALSVIGTERFLTRKGLQKTQQHAEKLTRALRAVTPAGDGTQLYFDLQHASVILGSSSLCLSHSLVGQVCYGALSQPVELVQGVRRVGHRLDFHAWLERDGELVFSTDDEAHTWTRLESPSNHRAKS